MNRDEFERNVKILIDLEEIDPVECSYICYQNQTSTYTSIYAKIAAVALNDQNMLTVPGTFSDVYYQQKFPSWYLVKASHSFQSPDGGCINCGVDYVDCMAGSPLVCSKVRTCCNSEGVYIWNFARAQWECPSCGAVKSNDPSYLENTKSWSSSPLKNPSCECGSSKVGSDRHSSWCALYKDNK